MITNWLCVYIVVSITPVGEFTAVLSEENKADDHQKASRRLAGVSILSSQSSTSLGYRLCGSSTLRHRAYL